MILTIRGATEKDIHQIRRIAQNTWPEAYGKILSQAQLDYMLDMMYSESSLHRQLAEGKEFAIAELAKTPIGFAGWSEESPEVIKLDKLYVLPGQQKSGAGKALLNHVLSIARSKKAGKLILNVNRHNPAKGFYERQGFQVVAEKDIDIGHGHFMNDYIMQKDL